MGSLEFNIREFDMNQIGEHPVCIFIGKRRTGKSILVLDYLYHNQDIPMGTCISPTDEFNRTFSGKIPDMFIHEEFTPELLEKFVHRQKIMSKRRESDSQYSDVDTRSFLIFDDCLYDAKNWVNDKNIRFIFMNGRHVGITFLLTMQYLLGIPPNLRSNVDYVFICKETKTNVKRKLFEYYAGMFPTFEMFNQVLNECTKDYGCMVIDNTTSSDKLDDQVFWYKSDIANLKKFKLCDDIFWKAHAKNEVYDKDDDELYKKPDYYRYTSGNKKRNFNVHRLANESTERSTSKGKKNSDFNPELLYR